MGRDASQAGIEELSQQVKRKVEEQPDRKDLRFPYTIGKFVTLLQVTIDLSLLKTSIEKKL